MLPLQHRRCIKNITNNIAAPRNLKVFTTLKIPPYQPRYTEPSSSKNCYCKFESPFAKVNGEFPNICPAHRIYHIVYRDVTEFVQDFAVAELEQKIKLALFMFNIHNRYLLHGTAIHFSEAMKSILPQYLLYPREYGVLKDTISECTSLWIMNRDKNFACPHMPATLDFETLRYTKNKNEWLNAVALILEGKVVMEPEQWLEDLKVIRRMDESNHRYDQTDYVNHNIHRNLDSVSIDSGSTDILVSIDETIPTNPHTKPKRKLGSSSHVISPTNPPKLRKIESRQNNTKSPMNPPKLKRVKPVNDTPKITASKLNKSDNLDLLTISEQCPTQKSQNLIDSPTKTESHEQQIDTPSLYVSPLTISEFIKLSPDLTQVQIDNLFEDIKSVSPSSVSFSNLSPKCSNSKNSAVRNIPLTCNPLHPESDKHEYTHSMYIDFMKISSNIQPKITLPFLDNLFHLMNKHKMIIHDFEVIEPDECACYIKYSYQSKSQPQ